jgi:LmbE family N-acetylglucosaminyl deacetylase
MSTHHDTNPRPGRLLGVWAHPDDESYLSAGLMARVLDDGGHVTVVAVTDGELGFGDDDTRPRAERSAHRRAEMTEAMATLGVTDVRFLGHPDGALASIPTAVVATALVAIMDETRPDTIVTFGPDGITGHDDHVATGAAVCRARLDHGDGDLLFAAQSTPYLDRWRPMHDEIGVWMTGEPDGVDPEALALFLSLRGAEVGRKRRALAAHHSQTAGLAAHIGEARYREWIAEECFRRPATHEVVEFSGSIPVAPARER